MRKLVVLFIVCVMSLMVAEGSAVLITSEDFEGHPLGSGWFAAAGAGALSTDQNHTSGGTQSAFLDNGSVAYTFPATEVSNVLDIWYYVGPGTDAAFNGTFDVMEVFFKDDTDDIVGQTWFRNFGLREYEAGGFISVLSGSDGKSLMNAWNHLKITWDYAAGIYSLDLNDGAYVHTAPAFGATDGRAGTGIKSVTFAHRNNTGGDVYLDDVVIPEPATMSLLLGGMVLGAIRRKIRA